MLAITAAAVVGCTTMGITSVASASGTPGTDATAVCTFNGIATPLLQGIRKGEKLAIACTGLPALHPYLIVEVSLLAAVDPQAAAALSGSVASPSGVLGLLAAVPEINIKSAAVPISDENGNLTEDWTVPTSQAPDKNAVCPPTRQQFNSGLVGCAIAMIDLTSGGPVDGGSAVMEYRGFPELPPDPSMVLSPDTASAGQTVTVADLSRKNVNKDTYWWVPTLAEEDSLLGGAAPTSTVTVTVGTASVDASGISVTAASYNGSVFTPPKLSGSFTVPPGLTGSQQVTVVVSAPILGLRLENGVDDLMTISSGSSG